MFTLTFIPVWKNTADSRARDAAVIVEVQTQKAGGQKDEE